MDNEKEFCSFQPDVTLSRQASLDVSYDKYLDNITSVARSKSAFGKFSLDSTQAINYSLMD